MEAEVGAAAAAGAAETGAKATSDRFVDFAGPDEGAAAEAGGGRLLGWEVVAAEAAGAAGT